MRKSVSKILVLSAVAAGFVKCELGPESYKAVPPEHASLAVPASEPVAFEISTFEVRSERCAVRS
jgi:hypothetical protein